MADKIEAGSIETTVGFKIDSRSLKNLDKFQKRISNLKKQLKGLGTSIKLQAKITDSGVGKINKSLNKLQAKKGSGKAPHPFQTIGGGYKEYLKEQSALMREQARILNKRDREDARREKDFQKRIENKKKVEAKATEDLKKRIAKEESVAWKEYDTHQKIKAKEKAQAEKRTQQENRLKERQAELAAKAKARAAAKAEREAQRKADHQEMMRGRLNTLKHGRDKAIGKSGLSPAQIDLTKQKWESLIASWRRGEITSKRLTNDLTDMNRKLKGQAKAVSPLIAAFKKLRHIAIAATGAYTAFAAVVDIKETGKKFEQAALMFNTSFGEDTADHMAFLNAETERLGTNFLDAAKGYSQLAYAAKETGMDMSEIKNIYSGLAEASVVFGMTPYQTANALRAVVQMFSKGTVSMEELRQQFGEHIPGAINLAAKSLGVTTEELNKMVKNGQVLAKDLLPKLADGLREVASPQLERAMKTLSVAEGRRVNAFERFKNTIMDGGLRASLIWLNDTLADIFNADSIREFGESLGRIVRMFMLIPASIKLIVAAVSDLDKYLGKMKDSFLSKFVMDWGSIFTPGLPFQPQGMLGTTFNFLKEMAGFNKEKPGMSPTPDNYPQAPVPPTQVEIHMQPELKEWFGVSKQAPVPALVMDVPQ